MKFKNLTDFLSFLDHKSQLKRINAEISADLEITEISNRFLNKNNPALLFNNIRKTDGIKSAYPVITNLFTTHERISWGLGLNNSSELENLGELLAFIRNPQPPSSFKEAINMMPLAKRVLNINPKLIRKGSCQEIIIEKPDLDILPIQKCWPDDVSPLITWPLIVTRGLNPQNDKEDSYNLGVYRLQKVGSNKLLMRWLKMRGGYSHIQKWKKDTKGTSMPAAAVVGTAPSIILSGVMPIPNTISEYNFAGFIQGRAVELVKCKTIDLKVPAHAEIVIEGEISFNEYMDEGPFGDHTGYYNDVEQFPVFNVKAITMKKNPVYLSTYTGKPPDEPSILGEALNAVFIPLIKQQFPEIVDFYLPPEGCSYRFAVVSIQKRYPGQAKRIMMGVWSFLQQFMYTKYLIIVDNDINIRNWKEVIWAISTRSDPCRDTSLIDNTPIDYLDFSSPISGLGGKMCIDATNKIAPETNRNWGKKIKMSEEVVKKIDKIWKDIL